jgi:uncharacterized protein (TIRG00374 family)
MITPLGSGQMIKSFFIEKRHGHSISKIIPLAFVERFNDLLATSIIISITLIINYSLPSLTVIIISYTLMGGFLLILKNTYFLKLFTFIIKKIPFVSQMFKIHELNESIRDVFNSKVLLKTIPFSVLIISLEGIVVYMGFLTFRIDIGYFSSIQIFYTSILTGAFSFIPGGVGVTEGSFVSLLIKKHLDLGLVTALIIFIRLTTIWFATASGFICSYFVMKPKSVDIH